MNIYIDSMTGGYIIGSILLLILTMIAFIGAWTEHDEVRKSRRTTTS